MPSVPLERILYGACSKRAPDAAACAGCPRGLYRTQQQGIRLGAGCAHRPHAHAGALLVTAHLLPGRRQAAATGRLLSVVPVPCLLRLLWMLWMLRTVLPAILMQRRAADGSAVALRRRGQLQRDLRQQMPLESCVKGLGTAQHAIEHSGFATGRERAGMGGNGDGRGHGTHSDPPLV